ncbi:MAG: hypothetical protein ABS69_09840 [Nitrosomonadales bacterium SCN 54-20]|nr:MAG: hypothetical protein ABS69_09840 [Nitrosomonadales bacterium SCN 54-20]
MWYPWDKLRRYPNLPAGQPRLTDLADCEPPDFSVPDTFDDDEIKETVALAEKERAPRAEKGVAGVCVAHKMRLTFLFYMPDLLSGSYEQKSGFTGDPALA